MVRKIYALSALLIACVSAVSALPAPGRQGAAETSCVAARLGARDLHPCSLPSHPKPTTTSNAQVLEQRAHTSRKSRAKKRADKGLPKATAADKNRIPGVDRVKHKPGMTAKKQSRVAERKEHRALARKQKNANTIALAFQKQKMPPFGMDANGQVTHRPTKEEVAEHAWKKYEKAQADKAARKAAWDALSPEDQEKKNQASAANRDADKLRNVKEKYRQRRIKTKAKARKARIAETRVHVAAARKQFYGAQGLPSRHDKFISPQGKPYTGKDIRQGVFASEYAESKGGVGYKVTTGQRVTGKKNKLPKEFENRPNKHPNSHPLPAAHHAGITDLKEYPIVHDKKRAHDGRHPNPTEARVITTKDSAGHTVLVGAVGHPHGTDGHEEFKAVPVQKYGYGD
ncbi:hypothetical protein CPC08DRAFT_561035 [Agrocybe pediades]|nr:hypothetical protein CPC08DRAFT_561035 [Agrocybe pediades]